MSQVPLHSHHVALGAKMGPFGGWDMPIEYAAGTLAEHHAVRTAVGVFDVSHMGKLTVSGQGAAEFVNSVLTNDLGRIGPGQAQYSMLCNDDGGIVDDLIVYLLADDEVRIVPNASNAATVAAVLTAAAPGSVRVDNQHDVKGILAVQGPKSAGLLAGIGLPGGHDYMAFVDSEWQGHVVTVCRTGYTGEHGYELVLPNSGLAPLWEAILEAGQPLGLLPCGLAARDTLRTEMGYPLHGQDISAEITPVEARTGWAVGWDKVAFHGREALLAQKAAGARRLAWGLKASGRGVPRPHMDVKDAAGAVVGHTTSGTFSPTLQTGIALALLDPSVSAGDDLTIDVRGRDLAVTAQRPPFVAVSTK